MEWNAPAKWRALPTIIVLSVIWASSCANATNEVCSLFNAGAVFSDQIIALMHYLNLICSLSLPCAICFLRGNHARFSLAGLAIGLVACLCLAAMGTADRWSISKYYRSVFIVLGASALVPAHICLVDCIRRTTGFVSFAGLWLGVSGCVSLAVVGKVVFAMIRYPTYPWSAIWDAYDLERPATYIGYALLMGVLTAQLFQRRARPELAKERINLTVTCPRCQIAASTLAGDSSCPTCGLRRRIDLETPACTKCGYLLTGLSSDRCPECGTPTSARVI